MEAGERRGINSAENEKYRRPYFLDRVSFLCYSKKKYADSDQMEQTGTREEKNNLLFEKIKPITEKMKIIPDALCDFSSRKYSGVFFIIFSFLCFWLTSLLGGYNVFSITGEHFDLSMVFYLADFSVGFESRLLLGAVLGLFYDTVTPEQIFRVAGIATLLSFILQAVITGIVLRKSLQKREFAVTALVAVFLMNPLVSQENIMAKGYFDTYELILFLCWLFFCDTKPGKLIVPGLCFLAILLHPGFMFSFMPPVLAIMFYGMFLKEKKTDRILSGTGFITGCVSTIGSFVYFVFMAGDRLRMTSEEFAAHLLDKFALTKMESIHFCREFGEYPFYYRGIEYYLFRKDRYREEYTSFVDFFGSIREEVSRIAPSVYVRYFIAFLPILIVFTLLWVSCMRKVRGTAKLPYLVFIGTFIMVPVGCFSSTDVWRWVSAGIITQYALLFALFRQNDRALLETLQSSLLKRRSVRILLAVSGAVYIGYMIWLGVDLPISF